jgi:hypothetical protein
MHSQSTVGTSTGLPVAGSTVTSTTLPDATTRPSELLNACSSVNARRDREAARTPQRSGSR